MKGKAVRLDRREVFNHPGTFVVWMAMCGTFAVKDAGDQCEVYAVPKLGMRERRSTR